jgi:hypothetical protein
MDRATYWEEFKRSVAGNPRLSIYPRGIHLGESNQAICIAEIKNIAFIEIHDIFTGSYERNVSIERFDEYMCKIRLLPEPTCSVSIVNGFVTKKAGNFIRINAKDGLFHYACDEFAIISNGSYEVVGVGAPVTINGKKFPYSLARLIEAEKR